VGRYSAEFKRTAVRICQFTESAMTAPEDGMLGLAHGQVRLAESTPRWATLFDEEAVQLAATLQRYGPSIEHCGSTSVPGLLAKPILDILIGVPGQVDVPGLVRALSPLGYEHAPRAGVPGHEVFGKDQPRTHLLHVVPLAGEAWLRMVGFRDTLRANPTLAAEYGALKRSLAAQFSSDRSAYTEGKAAFIAKVLGESATPAA
jgi:GrpB-like predicted nucleotidyltransferase (UPF0157 family)